MNEDKETKKRKLNRITKEILEQLHGISFVKFVPITDVERWIPPPVTIEIKLWEEIASTKERDDKIVSQWIVEIFIAEKIANKHLLLWGDTKRIGTPELAEVMLSDNYDWVLPIWKRGHYIILISLELGYSWNIFPLDNRYGFLKIKINDN